MISFKLIFTSQALRFQIYGHVNSCLECFHKNDWWEFNGVALERELEYISSKRKVKKIMYHAQHHDAYYLQQLKFELGEHLK